MAYKGKRMNPQKFERGQIKIMILLLPLLIFMAMPLVYIANHAFKPMDELFAFPPTFFVKNATFENFEKLAKFSRTSGVPMSRYIFNSIVVTGATVGFSLLFTTMSAFALSKLKFKGRNMMMSINQFALMFVPTAVLIPRYLVIAKTGMIDTLWAHILPLVAYPVALFLVKQFVDQVPDALIEAAYIDGATDFKVYIKLIIPMIKPAIATATILTFQQVWTNVETSNFFVNEDSMKTLTFYMNSMINVNNAVSGQGMSAAATLILFVPNLVLFIFCQNGVMNTMAHSGIK